MKEILLIIIALFLYDIMKYIFNVIVSVFEKIQEDNIKSQRKANLGPSKFEQRLAEMADIKKKK